MVFKAEVLVFHPQCTMVSWLHIYLSYNKCEIFGSFGLICHVAEQGFDRSWEADPDAARWLLHDDDRGLSDRFHRGWLRPGAFMLATMVGYAYRDTLMVVWYSPINMPCHASHEGFLMRAGGCVMCVVMHYYLDFWLLWCQRLLWKKEQYMWRDVKHFPS